MENCPDLAANPKTDWAQVLPGKVFAKIFRVFRLVR